VIADPAGLEPGTIAAIRRWVIKHHRTLAAHWRGQISSVELAKRLQEEQA
jgi:hypothetical protein